MSKLMSDLNNLNERRKADGVVVVSDDGDAKDVEEQPKAKYQGTYFLYFLVLVLIGLSTLSLSISFKTIARLEATSSEIQEVLGAVNRQQQDLKQLGASVLDNATEELSRINAISKKINTLEASVGLNGKELTKLKKDYSDLQGETEQAVKKLQASDRLMLDKYTSLNNTVQKLNEENLPLPDTY